MDSGTIKLAVLDMAGTTVRDAGQVPQAFVSALAVHGVVATPQAISNLRGASKRQAILELLPDGPDRGADALRVYATFIDHLARAFKNGVEPVPGAPATINLLREKGIRVALNTGFDRETTQLLLEALGWLQGFVDVVVCGDEVAQGRPAPFMIFRCMEATGVADVRSVAVAGDTVLDLQAGYNAGVGLNIGVLSGAHERSRMQTFPHTHLLESVAEIPELLSVR